jgi:hypothetical protein
MHGPAGFWSYAHEDDEQDSGRIRSLADAVKREYSLLTGEELQLFIDRDLQWGEEWRSRIDEALTGTTFFIPIITPRYFQRPECRRELLTFAGHAKSLGRQELLLSIYYVSVSGFDDERSSDDEAVELVASMQWDDWRTLRLEAEDSAAYRQRVNQLATRLASISQSLAEKDEEPVAQVSFADVASDDDEPGFLDQIAEAEDAFPKLTAVIVEIGEVLAQLGDLATGWNPTLERAASQGAGPALFALRDFSKQLDPLAGRMEILGKSYAAELVRVDPAILTLIRIAAADDEPSEDALELFRGIEVLHEAARESVAMFSDLTSTLEEVSQMSRDLRRPLRKIRGGLKTVLDGQAVLDEWHRRMTQVNQQWGEDTMD